MLFGECHYAECYPECHYSQCLYTECPYAACLYTECPYTKCHYGECRFIECYYAMCNSVECCGAFLALSTYQIFQQKYLKYLSISIVNYKFFFSVFQSPFLLCKYLFENIIQGSVL
jgi:hypothetical protein